MKIIEVPRTKIKPYWRNPRRNEKTVELLKKAIAKYGLRQPLVVDADNTIIVGHARYKALTELGWEKIPVVVADNLSEQEVAEYRLADNKIQEASTWNEDDLYLELRELPELGDLQEFFFDMDFDSMFAEVAGLEIEDIDAGDIERASAGLAKIGNRETFREPEPVMCPHCGGEFFVQ